MIQTEGIFAAGAKEIMHATGAGAIAKINSGYTGSFTVSSLTFRPKMFLLRGNAQCGGGYEDALGSRYATFSAQNVGYANISATFSNNGFTITINPTSGSVMPQTMTWYAIG